MNFKSFNVAYTRGRGELLNFVENGLVCVNVEMC